MKQSAQTLVGKQEERTAGVRGRSCSLLLMVVIFTIVSVSSGNAEKKSLDDGRSSSNGGPSDSSVKASGATGE